MLSWRIALGVTFTAILIGLCWLDAHAGQPGTYLLPLALLVAVAASQEVLGLLAAGALPAMPKLVYLGNATIVLASGLAMAPDRLPAWLAADESLIWPVAALTLVVAVSFLVEMIRYQQPGGIVTRLAFTWFAFIYVGLLVSFLVQLRLHGASATGMAALLSMIAVVKLGDIGAYTVGRLYGRRKLAPLLSPGKTIEGAAGGLAFSIGGAFLSLHALWPALSAEATPPAWWATLVYGVVVGAAGMVGDLAESLIKRDLGQKDSSRWMPGFGGVLDLVDSLLVAAPVALVWWRICLPK